MSDEMGFNKQREHQPMVDDKDSKVNLQWHELRTGNTLEIKRDKFSQTLTAKVLSFRKMMAIVLCTNGEYELFEPGEFNAFYSTKLIK